MNNEQKQEIQTLFLEEAQDYLNTIESNLLGISNSSVLQETIDQILRAAHSIKGGAAMMGFQDISEIAHRLEDYFKIIKGGRISFNDKLERLFLKSVDGLREMIPAYRQGKIIDNSWVKANIEPILNKLHQYIGDVQPEDEQAILAIKSEESDADMSVFIFETEVENILTELEGMIGNADISSVKEKLSEITIELGGLAEMLELSSFALLCQSIDQCLQDNPEQIEFVAHKALQELRRSQALVLAHQPQLIPTQLIIEPETITENLPSFDTSVLPTEVIKYSVQLLEYQEEKLGVSLSHEKELLPVAENSSPLKTAREKIDKTTHFSLETSTEKTTAENIDHTIRVSSRQIEELGDLFGELTIERNGLDLQIKNLRNILNYFRQKVQYLEKSNFQLRTLYDQVAIPSGQQAPPINSLNSTLSSSQSLTLKEADGFDLLEMDRYNDLHLVSGDMMETIVQIQEATNDFEIYLTDTEKLNKELTRTSKLMQNNLNQVRMRPISDLLNRFPRALRDMEIQYKKRVEMQTKGSATLLEKNVLEALNDPLLHLFRNAFDHGMENAETRKKLGKPEIGKIEISAAYRGNQTIITISDDGKGIDLDKIRAKARKMGLNDQDIADTTEKELLDLIFEPGFSTSEIVTELSGRGVGMDVVRKNIEKIGGHILVETNRGIGTKFILSVPFTLSVVRVLLVESQKMLLAFPSNAVEEVNLFDTDMVIEKEGKEYLNWDDEDENKVRLFRLHQYLQFAHSSPNLDTEAIPIINEPTLLMIEQNKELVGLMVDRYWGEQEVTIRQVEGKLKMPPGFTNCTILGDGRVVPLIDAVELLNWIEQQNENTISYSFEDESFTSSLMSNNVLNSSNKNNIMVVDDSINVRRFLALTFSQQNYHVEQAKDGQDALEKLQSGIPIQAVICDIEMPRLDGYGFLANVKSDHNFKHIPVVMLTSRSGEKHRKMAMNLGATAYFSKPFQERELLGLVKNLI